MTLPVPWNIWRSRNTACKTTGGPDVVCVIEWIYEYSHGQINAMSRPNSSLRCKRFQSSYYAKVRAEAKKKGWTSFPSPSPVIHFFFCSCPSFLDEPREETLATQAILPLVPMDHRFDESYPFLYIGHIQNGLVGQAGRVVL